MPDEDIKALIRRNIELTKENNKLLKKMRRDAFIGMIFKLIWFVIIIGVPIYIYYFILQPYLLELSASIEDIQNGVAGAQDVLFDAPFVGELFERLEGAKDAVTPATE